jgi:basic membrane lipoprotein Med (substrate-binding protein (PBP1-ABC) superfamily)
MKMKHIKGFALAAVAAMTLAACGGSDDAASDTTAAAEAGADYSSLKVAVVYIGVPDDKGWTYQHEQGILSLESELGIEVKRVENVPEGDEAEAVMEELAAGGYNLIFATSFGYGTPMARVATRQLVRSSSSPQKWVASTQHLMRFQQTSARTLVRLKKLVTSRVSQQARQAQPASLATLQLSQSQK